MPLISVTHFWKQAMQHMHQTRINKCCRQLDIVDDDQALIRRLPASSTLHQLPMGKGSSLTTDKANRAVSTPPTNETWTIEQDCVLVSKWMKHGWKWHQVASEIPGRSARSCKERFDAKFMNRDFNKNRAEKSREDRMKSSDNDGTGDESVLANVQQAGGNQRGKGWY